VSTWAAARDGESVAAPPIPALTGLRFAAALLIVVGHGFRTFLPFSGPTHVGYELVANITGVGMPLFFVLSGFVIHYNYGRSLAGRRGRGLYAFFVARFARLYPLYVFGLAFDVFNSYSYYQLTPYVGNALLYYVPLIQSWVYRPEGNAALIYAFGPLPSVAWSISTEWFLYLVFPIVCAVIARARRPGTIAIFMVIVTAVALALVSVAIVNRQAILAAGVARYGPVAADPQSSYFRWLLYFSPYSRVFEFTLGCLTSALFLRLPPADADERRLGSWLTVASLLGLLAVYGAMFGWPVASRPHWHASFQLLHMSFGFAPFIALLIFCCARYDTAVVRALDGRWVVLGGEASYSLYLWHTVIMDRVGLGSPAPATVRIMAGAAMRLALCVFTCIGLSLVSWQLIEVPARKWLRRVLSRPVAR
jgi:peptidoglycan/LPS O-acetylase OafA/YrhL